MYVKWRAENTIKDEVWGKEGEGTKISTSLSTWERAVDWEPASVEQCGGEGSKIVLSINLWGRGGGLKIGQVNLMLESRRDENQEELIGC